MAGGENAILGPSYMASALLGHVKGSTIPAPPVDAINKADEIIFDRPTTATPMATDNDKIGTQASSGGHRSPKCAIHGEGCDNKATIYKRRSETVGETGGFLEQHPVVDAEEVDYTGMLDWHKMYQEERVKLGDLEAT
ncbi:hypothetical protein IQ07DRAFT_588116 [Pyrenochaeta sp. DS3sAY3a]|nr:hypothetical protein IQ07DRAFT_588116 [Pyrenochaeta sp. DS3sAY3a]